MVQNSILYIARNNQPIELCTPMVDEAQTTLDAMVEISESSPYILSTPESFKQRTTESQMKWIQDSISSQNSIIIAAYFNGKIIGFCNGQSYKDIKRSHRAGSGYLPLTPSVQSGNYKCSRVECKNDKGNFIPTVRQFFAR